MLYVPDENYRYLISSSDNYVVLTNVPSANGSYNNPDYIDTLTVYLKPSTFSFYDEKGYTSTRTFIQVEVSDSFWNRGDVPEILCGFGVLLFLLLLILNIFGKLLRPGGVFFG